MEHELRRKYIIKECDGVAPWKETKRNLSREEDMGGDFDGVIMWREYREAVNEWRGRF